MNIKYNLLRHCTKHTRITHVNKTIAELVRQAVNRITLSKRRMRNRTKKNRQIKKKISKGRKRSGNSGIIRAEGRKQKFTA